MFRQHQDREGEEGAREAARDDPDGNQRGRNRWGDGEGEEVLPAADVRGPSRHHKKLDGFYFETPAAWPSLLLTQSDQCVHSISSKSMRSKSRKGWTCCRTSSSTSTHSASKTRCFYLFYFFILFHVFFPNWDGNRSLLHLTTGSKIVRKSHLFRVLS